MLLVNCFPLLFTLYNSKLNYGTSLFLQLFACLRCSPISKDSFPSQLVSVDIIIQMNVTWPLLSPPLDRGCA